jgi:hypothetical protein
MTWDEAVAAMREGKHVRRPVWDERITMHLDHRGIRFRRPLDIYMMDVPGYEAIDMVAQAFMDTVSNDWQIFDQPQ